MITAPRFRTTLALLSTALLLFGCAEARRETVREKAPKVEAPQSMGRYKIGDPYEIDGVWYYPRVDYDYAETGIASWYGPGFHGKRTANGELYNQHAMTAAHRTLPMPSVVRVTNLANGHSVKVRVNDRGPFARNRIIDLSYQAATLLGFVPQGTAKVRVEILAEESRQVATRAQSLDPDNIVPAAAPLQTVTAEELPPINGASVATAPSAIVRPGPQVAALPPQPARPAPAEEVDSDLTVDLQPAEGADLYIQAGAFTRIHNATRLKVRLSKLAPTNIVEGLVGDDLYYRVRLGPLDSVEAADRMLDLLYANGVTDARVVLGVDGI